MLTIRRARLFDGTRLLDLSRLERAADGRSWRVVPEPEPDRPGGSPLGLAPDAPDQDEARLLDPSGGEIDAGGALVTPGLVDCHTHVIWGGSREEEFGRRLAGASYAEILAAGGGIHATVRATRAASDAELTSGALARLRAMLRRGVTTVEIKSGYGLAPAQELRLLRLVGALRGRTSQRLTATLLAHVIPPDSASDRAAYLRQFCESLLPRVAEDRVAEACDVFCEAGAFTLDETRLILTAARQLGLALHVHAEQLSRSGGARLAAEMGALSADHLEWIDDDDIAAMAQAGTVAVLLPGAELTLGTPAPPVDRLRAAGVTLAIATDCNPGSSHTTDLLLMVALGCLRYRLAPEEGLAAVTEGAARALGAPAGRTAAARLAAQGAVIWRVATPAALLYRIAAEGPAAIPSAIIVPPHDATW